MCIVIMKMTRKYINVPGKYMPGIRSSSWGCKYFLPLLDCFTLLLARHLADVSCYIGPSMPSGICMEIHTEIGRNGRRNHPIIRELLGNPTSIYRLTNHVSVQNNQSQTLIETFWEATNGPNKQRYLMPSGINARVSRYYICWHSITIKSKKN